MNNNNKLFVRKIQLADFKASAFLFGPRWVGKTTLLRSLTVDVYFDLLDPQLELEYKTNPNIFWQQLSALKPGSRIIVDEVQKVPALLNYVQMGIDKLNHKFLLSGSSARKLKRGHANLLGGRAISLKLHPLSCEEIGKGFSLPIALEYGTLPKIYLLSQAKQIPLVREHLKSYVSAYLKEEIQMEAVTRNLGAFNRFLNVAAQSNGQIIEFANISRECAVPASTVKEYFQILEDTLIGFFLWPFAYSERKKTRPKFYFFDCGVVRAIQGRVNDSPSSVEKGYLFETWFINELMRMRDCLDKPHEFSFWRNREQEVDIIVSRSGKPVLGIECKSGKSDIRGFVVNSFRDSFGKIPLIVASLSDIRAKKVGEVEILPWQDALSRYQQLA